MVHVEKIDAKLPAYADFPDVLSENSRAALRSLGFSRLYSHQVLLFTILKVEEGSTSCS